MDNTKLINLNEKIFVAGANGMVGSLGMQNAKKRGYGSIENGGNF